VQVTAAGISRQPGRHIARYGAGDRPFRIINGSSHQTLHERVAWPDPKTLKIGDRIRILGVPENDVDQRATEIASGTEMAGWTADSIERIIAQTPVVQISEIDEYGCVWYETTIIGSDGTEESHSLIVYDDDTWEHVAEAGR